MGLWPMERPLPLHPVVTTDGHATEHDWPMERETAYAEFDYGRWQERRPVVDMVERKMHGLRTRAPQQGAVNMVRYERVCAESF